MERDVLSDAAVAAVLREGFVAVAVRRSGPSAGEPWSRYGLPDGGSPAFVLVGSDGAELDRDFYGSTKEEFLGTLALWQAGRTTDALRKEVEAHPDHAERRFLLGRRLARRRDRSAAEHLRRAVELDPEGTQPWSAEARWLLLEPRSDAQALADIAALARRWPESCVARDAHFRLAIRHSARGEAKEAIASFEYLRTHGALEGFEVDYARLLAFEDGDAELGLRLIDGVLLRSPRAAACHDIRAECLERLGRKAEALAAAEEAAGLADSEGDRREFRRALRERRKRCAPQEPAK
jgi:tetratricopeptide (TPR) repeat protein